MPNEYNLKGNVIMDDNANPSHSAWDNFLRFRESESFFLLYLSPLSPLCLPKRLVAEGDLDGLRALLSSAIGGQDDAGKVPLRLACLVSVCLITLLSGCERRDPNDRIDERTISERATPIEPTVSLPEAVSLATEYIEENSLADKFVMASVQLSQQEGLQPVWFIDMAKEGQIAEGEGREYVGAIHVTMDKEVYMRRVVLAQ